MAVDLRPAAASPPTTRTTSRRDDHEPHDALLCIGTGTTLDDPKRFRFDGQRLLREVAATRCARSSTTIPSRRRSTLEIAERCNARARDGQVPPARVPGAGGHDARGGAATTQALDRACAARLGLAPDEPLRASAAGVRASACEHELGVIETMGFAGYFLIVADFIGYARAQRHPGRARAAARRRAASSPTASASPASIRSSTTSSSSAS